MQLFRPLCKTHDYFTGIQYKKIKIENIYIYNLLWKI